MTRALFERQLPDDINVFDAIGDVLPPLENANKFHKQKLTAPPADIARIRDALTALSEKATDKNLASLAAVYADMASAALSFREESFKNTDPMKECIPFEG